MLKYRVLKTVILCCLLLFLVKISELYQSKNEILSLFKTEEASAQEKTKQSEKKEKDEVDTRAKGAAKVLSVDEIKSLSDTDIEILQRLAQSRDKLQKWEQDLSIKENVLKITEERIDTKLQQLRLLKAEVEKSLTAYRKQEEEKTKSLVKIYENMKPKNAADILQKMDVNELVPIIDKMKEKNAAEIMAKMDPAVAKEITSKLNKLGKLENPEYN
ncbi:MAG TPA: hypothetical protein DIV86_05680 [Alphaproteobacteria bacterium]|nr:hypothetical protein [Alphaproteobacteria bacterium]